MLSAAVDREAGRHLTINATGAIAALLLEIDFPAEVMRAVAVISRCGGLAGHIIEERERRSARTRSEEHTSEHQELKRISYAVVRLKKERTRSYSTTASDTQNSRNEATSGKMTS